MADRDSAGLLSAVGGQRSAVKITKASL